jgi:hypothetical protein
MTKILSCPRLRNSQQNVHHNLNDERGESPKTPHEKDYVMRFTRANGPVIKLVEIIKLVTT